MSFCHILFCVSLVARVCATPHGPLVIPRDTESNTRTPVISATIVDHAGNDIAFSFQIMLYHPAATLIHHTNNSLSNRQASLSRPINACPTGAFYESFCTPEHDKAGSLQSYRIICQVVVPVLDASSAVVGHFIPNQAVVYRPRDGHCAEDEICVAGLGAGRSRTGRQMASCVQTQYFVKYLNWGNNRGTGLDLNGMSASMVVSRPDGTTPMEVDTFEIDAEKAAGRATEKKTCRDCVQLGTGQLGANTKSLKMETTLLTTGAIAGVLWLAIVSG